MMLELNKKERAIVEQLGTINALRGLQIILPHSGHTFTLIICHTPRGQVIVLRREKCRCFGGMDDDEEYEAHRLKCFEKLVDRIRNPQKFHQPIWFAQHEDREPKTQSKITRLSILQAKGINIIN